MTDKKEIFDYLRNQQKASEIEAKVNGINIWVLLGAIAIVIWQIIPSVQTDFWTQRELILRVLLFAEAIYLIGLCLSPITGISEEVRYTSQDSTDIGSALVFTAAGTILILPPLLSFLVIGKSFSMFPAGFFGFALIIMSIFSIYEQIVSERSKSLRLPKPNFKVTMRFNIFANLLFLFMFLVSIAEQSAVISSQIILISSEYLKFLALLIALYMLVLISLQCLLRSRNLLWTYELETELLLDIISTRVALRRIEYRALGPRLRDVIDTFFNDLDKLYGELESQIIECRTKLEEVSGIPGQYTTERGARIESAIKQPEQILEVILKECRNLSNYLERLKKQKTDRKQAVMTIIPSLEKRQIEYEERANKSKNELEEMLISANSGDA